MTDPIAFLPGAETRFLKGRRVDPHRAEPIPSQALRLALFDEMRAQTFYTMVLERHGPHQPFLSIVQAEGRHFDGLAHLARSWGVAVPENTWRRTLAVPDSFADCCALGMEAEVENAEMYRHFLEHPLPPILERAFQARCMASTDHHLPAFTRCAGPDAPRRLEADRKRAERDKLWWGVIVGAGAVTLGTVLYKARSRKRARPEA